MEYKHIETIRECIRWAISKIENYTYPGYGSDNCEMHMNAYNMKLRKLNEIDEAKEAFEKLINKVR